MNYAIQQRMRFIDFLLHRYGTFNLLALMDYFGISKVQASMDMRAYIALAPDNARYDLAAKTYKRTADFKRVLP